MKPRIAVVLMAAGCWRAGPVRAVPETETFVFDQEQAMRTNAPRFEADVILPAGTADWRLSVRCRHDGIPCSRGSVVLDLRFARSTPPDVRLTLRHAGKPAPPATDSSCFEDMFTTRPVQPACTLSAHEGWDNHRRTEGRHQFLARVENAGPATKVHVTITVIDPLE